MKSRSFFSSVFILVSVVSVAQTTFRYKRVITHVDRNGWYEVNLPADIFQDLNHDLTDIRLYSVEDGDTLEIPYLLDVQEDVISHQAVALPMFNKSYRDGSLYLTFEQRQDRKVNHLDLKFSEDNYFGWVSLEGSDDRKEWFEIIREQRIVSVHKNNGDYVLSRVNFPVADYRFLRAKIQADVPLTFQNASFHYTNVEKGNFLELPVRWTTRVEKKTKESIIDALLEHSVPVSSVVIKTDTSSDYYRPLRIEYVADSFNTDKGWRKRYETLYEGHLTSFSPNVFKFPWKLARELRLTVTNNDNQPIPVDAVEVAGPRVRIVARLEPHNHLMLYGSDDMRPPKYDLAYFENKIPDSVMTARLQSAELMIPARESTSALFENKLWLWVTMIVMVAGLGVFTVKMMTEKREVNV